MIYFYKNIWESLDIEELLFFREWEFSRVNIL